MAHDVHRQINMNFLRPDCIEDLAHLCFSLCSLAAKMQAASFECLMFDCRYLWASKTSFMTPLGREDDLYEPESTRVDMYELARHLFS